MFNPWVGKSSWRRKWQHTLVFLPGKSYGQRSLVGHSPWSHELDNLATKPPPTNIECSSTLKKNATCSNMDDLEVIILSEVNQTEKDKYCMISPVCGI